MRRILTSVLLLLSMVNPILAEEKTTIQLTDVTYIAEDGKTGFGIKLELKEQLSLSDMSEIAQFVCNNMMPDLLENFKPPYEEFALPTFAEVDAKVPKSLGIFKFNTGQVRVFDIVDQACEPAWE